MARRGTILNFNSAVTGCALSAAILVGVPTAALAAPGPDGLVPFEEATLIDREDVIWTDSSGLLTSDGYLLCAEKPESIAYSDGTGYPCFTGLTAGLGIAYPLELPTLVPFDEATVIDPSTVTIVPGGVITAEGADLCAVDPGSIVFPDGQYPCYIGYVQRWGVFGTAQDLMDGVPRTPFEGTPRPALDEAPQVVQLPVGGADTGVGGLESGDTNSGALLSTGILGMGVLALGIAFGAQAGRRR